MMNDEETSMVKLLSQRFAELISQYGEVVATARPGTDLYGSSIQRLDNSKLMGWATKAKSLLTQASAAVHLAQFEQI